MTEGEACDAALLGKATEEALLAELRRRWEEVAAGPPGPARRDAALALGHLGLAEGLCRRHAAARRRHAAFRAALERGAAEAEAEAEAGEVTGEARGEESAAPAQGEARSQT